MPGFMRLDLALEVFDVASEGCDFAFEPPDGFLALFKLVRLFRRERPDPLNLAVTSVFPGAVFVQISNSLAVRQIRPRGVDEVEIFQTMLGYQDDPPEMVLHRLRQANLVGPAGLVSMEDGEAIEITYRAVAGDRQACSVVEMGGAGEIKNLEHRVNDMPVRGFWSYYAQLMGIEPPGAVR